MGQNWPKSQKSQKSPKSGHIPKKMGFLCDFWKFTSRFEPDFENGFQKPHNKLDFDFSKTQIQESNPQKFQKITQNLQKQVKNPKK